MATDSNFDIVVGADLRKLNADLSTSNLGAVDGLVKGLTRVVKNVETFDRAVSQSIIGVNQLKSALSVVKWDQSMTPAGMALTNKNLQIQADKGYKVLYDNLRNKYNNDLKKTREEFIRQVQPSLSSTITQGPRGGANPSRAFVEKASTLKSGSVFDDLLAKQTQYEKESLLKQDNSERSKLRATNRYTSQLIREIENLHGQEIAAETNKQKRLQLIKKASIDAMRQMELQGRVAPSGYGVDAGSLAVGVGAIRARKLRDKEIKDQEEIAKIKNKYGEKEITVESARQNKILTNAKVHSDSLARGEENAAQRSYNTAMRRYASELAQQGQFINSAEGKAKAHAEVMDRIKSRGYGVGSGIVGVNEQGNRANLIWDTAVDAAGTVEARRNAKTEAEQKASNSRKEKEDKRHNDTLQRGDESAAQRAYNGFAKAAAAELARTGQYHNTAEVKEKIHQMAMERLRSGSYGSLGNLTRIDGAGNRSLELQNRAHAAAELSARRQNAANTPKPSVNVLARAEGQQVQNKIRMDAYGGMASQSMRMDTMAGYAMAGATVGGGFAAVNQVVELDKALKNVQAISSSTREQMVGLTEQIKKVGGAYSYTATEVANAGTILAQAGYGASGIKDMLESVALLAQASGSTIEKSADTITSIMTIFGKSGDQASMVADQMVGAINQTKLGMDQLQLGIQYAGNLAAEMNVPMLELVSIFGAAANAGIKSGSTLGTNTRQLLQEFADPSKKFIEMLGSMGLKVADVDVRVLGFTRVMKKLAEAGFTGADAMQAFEVRSGSMYTALSNQLDVLSDLPTLIDSAKDAADIAAGIQMESVANSGARAWSNFGLVLTEFSAGPMGVLKVALDGLVTAFQFLSTTAGPTLQILGGIITAVFMATIPNALRVAIGNFFRFKTEILQASLAQDKSTVSTRAAILAYLALASAKSKATASTAATTASEIAENAARGAGVVTTSLDTAAERANTLALNDNSRSTVVNTGAQAANTVAVGLGTKAKLAATGAIAGMTAAGGALMALMGGPIGIALMAASAAAVYFSMQATKADDSIQKLTDATTQSTEELDKAKTVMDYTGNASDLYAQKVKALGAEHTLTDAEVVELNNSLGQTEFGLVNLGDTLGQVSVRLSQFAHESNIAANAARALNAENIKAEYSARLLTASMANTYTGRQAFMANLASGLGYMGGSAQGRYVRAGQVNRALTPEEERNISNLRTITEFAEKNNEIAQRQQVYYGTLNTDATAELAALDRNPTDPRLRASLHGRINQIVSSNSARLNRNMAPKRARVEIKALEDAARQVRARYPLNHPVSSTGRGSRPPTVNRPTAPRDRARGAVGRARGSLAAANVASAPRYSPSISKGMITDNFNNIIAPQAEAAARAAASGGTQAQQDEAGNAARAAAFVRRDNAVAKVARSETKLAEALTAKNLREANRIRATELGEAKYVTGLEGNVLDDQISATRGSLDKFSNIEDFDRVEAQLKDLMDQQLDNDILSARLRLSTDRNKTIRDDDPDFIRAVQALTESAAAKKQKSDDDVKTKRTDLQFKAASFVAEQAVKHAAEDYEILLDSMTGGIVGNLAKAEEVIEDKIRADRADFLADMKLSTEDMTTWTAEQKAAYLEIGVKARGKLGEYLSSIIDASFNNTVRGIESDMPGTYNRVQGAAATRNGNTVAAAVFAERQERRINDARRERVESSRIALESGLADIRKRIQDEDIATSRLMAGSNATAPLVDPVVVTARRENRVRVDPQAILLTKAYTEAQIELAAATGEVNAALQGTNLTFEELASQSIADAIKATGAARDHLDSLAEGLGEITTTLSDGFKTFYEDILSGNNTVIDSFSDLLKSVGSRLKSLAAEMLANYTMMVMLGVLFPEGATGMQGDIGTHLRAAGVIKAKPGANPAAGTSAGASAGGGILGALMGLGSTSGPAAGTSAGASAGGGILGALMGLGSTPRPAAGTSAGAPAGIVAGDNTQGVPSATTTGVQVLAQNWLSSMFSGIFQQKEGSQGIFSTILNLGKSFFGNIMQGIFGGKDGGGVLGGFASMFGKGGGGGGGDFWASLISGLQGVFAGGFADGGFIPGANSNKDNKIAAVRSGEFVLRPEAVKSLGLDFLSNVNKSGLSGITPMINPAMGAAFTEGLGAGSLLGQSRSIADQVARAPRAASGLQSLDQKIVLVDSRADRPSMGPNDVLAAVSKDLQNRGALYKVIKEMR